MLAMFNTRKATTADSPFLARVEYEVSLPPLNHCFWEDRSQGSGTTALPSIEAKFRADDSNWSTIADFLILEAGQVQRQRSCADYGELHSVSVVLFRDNRTGVEEV